VIRAFRFIILFFLLIPAVSSAQRNFGLGIVLGDPTGITAKYVLSSANALDTTFSFGSGNKFYLHGSWLWLKPNQFNMDRYPVSLYFGIGPRLINHDHGHGHRHDDHSDDFHLAARAPIGLRMNFADPLIELFGEIAIAMDVIPKMEVDFDFGIGARFYF
jgi:hypothetical protein